MVNRFMTWYLRMLLTICLVALPLYLNVGLPLALVRYHAPAEVTTILLEPGG
jgi:hypothetical protein